ncbi:MAG: porin [Bosea sp.]|uniref:porin n=1 Tax=Bosea sp. (in: a-proteobacteria) TaxID=1871050 RepID=UPI001ACAF4EB|nr:porin [Bosea sp. (in: a-proteobacteria)]MBN9450431.1 porin [Bosea sp. (in: a-proteobacteria)]
MKLVKSLLLGSAAGIAAVAGAQAADLPSRKAAPVEYVRVCSAFGANFFYLPGTDTCLRIGGRVRAEYSFGERWSSGQDAFGTRARGRVFLDARNQTAYGTLRTFIRYDVTTTTGVYRYSGSNSAANRFSSINGVNQDDSMGLTDAVVQLGPLTAGRTASMFQFYANDYTFHGARTSDRQVNLLAYTASFGGGFTATVSLEDPRTTGRLGTSANYTDLNGVVRPTGGYAGMTYPDVVAQIRVDQGWGSASLSGAFGDRSTYSSPYVNYGTALAPNFGTGAKKDEMGWAIQGGVKINLPMLAAGDALFVQAAYADGALEYIGWGSNAGHGRVPAYAVGNFTTDGFGRVKSTTGYTLLAAMRHYWTPSVRSDFLVSYSALKTANLTPNINGVQSVTTFDPKELVASANLVWSPVSGLDIGVEVLYARTEFGGRVIDPKTVAGMTPRYIKSDDSWSGRLRVQRDF